MVFNIPTVGEDRLEKLKKVLSGVFSLQNMYKFNDYYPLNEEGKTKVFLTFFKSFFLFLLVDF